MKKKYLKKGKQMKFNKKQIKEAVDIVIGDDGFRGKEVIEVLEMMSKEKDEPLIPEWTLMNKE